MHQHTAHLLLCFLGTTLLDEVNPQAQGTPDVQFDTIRPLPSAGFQLRATGQRGSHYEFQRSFDLETWQTLSSVASPRGRITVNISDTPSTAEFFRLIELAEAPPLTGDYVPTESGNLILHPINHGSFAMWWNGLTLYVDPVGGASAYSGLPSPDLVFITHPHGDHFDASTLRSVVTDATTLIAPEIVTAQMSASLRTQTRSLANGDESEFQGIKITAIPAYNLTQERLNFHPKGIGNSYLVELGNRRVYFSGDTEDIPEIRALENIDVAFLCMNLPFTMTAAQAADATREFQPRIVYPYHFRGSSTQEFMRLVGNDLPIEVRIRTWY